MKALLIAGGLGTRLRPLTYTRPKHLLPIANRRHIDHVIDLLARHGILDVVLLSSYLAASFSPAIEDAAARGVTIEVAHEPEPLGTGGAIKNAAHLLGQETFFAFNADVLTSVDLSAVLAFHRDKGELGTIVLTPVDDPSAFGVVETDGDQRVTRFVEKPPAGTATTNLINAGIYVFEPSVLDAIPGDQVVSIEREVFPHLAEQGGLYATPTPEYWMDIGTPEKYLQANLDALTGRFPTDAVASPSVTAVVRDESSTIAPGAQVSSACIGRNCVVEAGAIVSEAVLLDGVHVSSGARIERSTLGANVRVAGGVLVSGRAIGDHESIEA